LDRLPIRPCGLTTFCVLPIFWVLTVPPRVRGVAARRPSRSGAKRSGARVLLFFAGVAPAQRRCRHTQPKNVPMVLRAAPHTRGAAVGIYFCRGYRGATNEPLRTTIGVFTIRWMKFYTTWSLAASGIPRPERSAAKRRSVVNIFAAVTAARHNAAGNFTIFSCQPFCG
jgi:hypothetical protein